MERFAAIYARVALGSAFLSAVAARFGLWQDRGPHPFAQFVQYTAEVNSFLPASFAPWLAGASTIAETTLGILLIAGFKPRWTGLASAILLALFGTAMTISGGIKSAFDASVFSASAAALLLAVAAGPGGREAPEVSNSSIRCARERAIAEERGDIADLRTTDSRSSAATNRDGENHRRTLAGVVW